MTSEKVLTSFDIFLYLLWCQWQSHFDWICLHTQKLRHKFSKQEIDRYRKAFYNVKSYKNISISEIKEAGKSLTRLKKIWDLKNFTVLLIVLIMKTLIIMIIIMILLMMMNIEKMETLEHYLKSLIVIITNQ